MRWRWLTYASFSPGHASRWLRCRERRTRRKRSGEHRPSKCETGATPHNHSVNQITVVLTIVKQKQGPAALGGGTTTANTASPRDVAPEVPGQVKSSLAEAGEAPEAAASKQAVHNKGQVESELLGHAAEAGVEDEASRQQQHQQQFVKKGPRPPPPGTLPRMDSGPQTPSTGVAVVLGTDTERSFPLGSHPVHHSTGDENEAGAEQGQHQQAAHSARSEATDGVRSGEIPETSSGRPSGVAQ